MTLFEAQENKYYKVIGIQAVDEELKDRLLALGITKNTEVFLERFSSNKDTLAIKINHSKVALRSTEAQHILVEAV